MPKGRKTCPECNAAVPCRSKVCPGCGHEFVAKAKPQAPAHRASDILPKPSPPGPPPLPGPSEPLAADIEPSEEPEEPLLCIHHPKYQGIERPRVACEGCWRSYLKTIFGEKGIYMRPFDTSRVMNVNDERKLTEFIKDLTAARDRSKHTGGCYSAFLHGKKITLQVEVHLSPRQE